MSTAVSPRPACWPPAPNRPEDLGLPEGLIIDLMLRHLRQQGVSSFASLSRSMKTPSHVIEALFRPLHQQELLEVKGTLGDDYQFRLTNKGRALATERSEVVQYAGPLPVSIAEYHRSTRQQSAHLRVTREALRAAFADLVLPQRLLDQIGPAIISQKSIFLYGPTGNGKTSIAERMGRVYPDRISIPYAVEVDGQIVIVYDPVVHEGVDIEDETADARWVPCKRPCVMTGGELVSSMLELRLDETNGAYVAPLQMKANNGILLVDDFGRQVISPREMLNRWIVPLDRRVDYLTLRSGVKFQIPFELMVIFSTNLDPADLADEAFLRRIQNKIYVDAVDTQTFDQIFELLVLSQEITAAQGAGAFLRETCLRHAGALRACYPRDICDIVSSISRYENRPFRLAPNEIQRAAEIYFTRPQ